MQNQIGGEKKEVDLVDINNHILNLAKESRSLNSSSKDPQIQELHNKLKVGISNFLQEKLPENSKMKFVWKKNIDGTHGVVFTEEDGKETFVENYSQLLDIYVEKSSDFSKKIQEFKDNLQILKNDINSNKTPEEIKADIEKLEQIFNSSNTNGEHQARRNKTYGNNLDIDDEHQAKREPNVKNETNLETDVTTSDDIKPKNDVDNFDVLNTNDDKSDVEQINKTFDKTNNFKRFNEPIIGLKKGLTDIKDELKKNPNEINVEKISNIITETEKHIAELEVAILDKQHEILKLKNDYSDRIKKINEKYRAYIAKKHSEINELRYQLEVLKAKLAKAIKQLEFRNPNELEELNVKIQALSGEKNRLEQEVKSLKKANETEIASIKADAKRQVDEAVGKYNSCIKTGEQLDAKVTELESQLAICKDSNQLEAVTKELKDAKEEIERNKITIQENINSLARLNEELSISKAELASIKETHKGEIEKVKEEAKIEYDKIFAELNETKELLKNCGASDELQKLQKEVTRLTGELTKVTETLDALKRSSVIDLASANTNARKEVEAITKKLNEALERLKSCNSTQELEDLKREIKSLTTDRDDAKRNLIKVQTEYRLLKEKSSSELIEIKKIHKKEIDEINLRLSEALEKLKGCNSDNNSKEVTQLKQQIQFLTVGKDAATRNWERARSDLEALRTKSVADLEVVKTNAKIEIDSITLKLNEALEKLKNSDNSTEVSQLKQKIEFLIVEKDTSTRNWNIAKTQLEEFRTKALAATTDLQTCNQNLLKSKQAVELGVKRIQTLEKQLESASNNAEYAKVVKELGIAKQMLEADKNDIKQARIDLEKLKATHASELKDARKEIDTINGKLNEANEKLKNCSSSTEATQLKQKIQFLTVEKDTATRNWNTAKTQLEELRTKAIAEFNAAKEEANKTLLKCKQGSELSVKRIQTLEKQLEAASNNADYTRVVKELADAKQMLAADKNDIKEVTMNLEKIKAAHSGEIRNIKAEAKKEVDAISGKLNEANEKLKSCNPQEAVQLKQKIQFLTVEKDTATRNWNTAKTQLEELRTKSIAEIEKNKTEAAQSLSKCKQGAELSVKRIQALEKQLETPSNNAELEKVKKDLASARIQLEADKNDIKNATINLEKIRASHVSEIQTIKAEAKKEVDAINGKLNEANEKLKGCNSQEATQLKQKIGFLTVERDSAKRNWETAKSQLEDLRNKAKVEFDKINAEKNECTEKLKSCNPLDKVNLQKQLESVKAELESTRQLLKDAQSRSSTPTTSVANGVNILEENFTNDSLNNIMTNQLIIKMNNKSGGLYIIKSVKLDNVVLISLAKMFRDNNIKSFKVLDFPKSALKNSTGDTITLDRDLLEMEKLTSKGSYYNFTMIGTYREINNKFIINSIGSVKERNIKGGFDNLYGGSDYRIQITVVIQKLNLSGGIMSDPFYAKYMKYKAKYLALK
jgi:chromosome segregation ATPase